jgi:SAM-dependent methyltransferase
MNDALALFEAHARACDPQDFQGQVMRNPNGKPVDDAQVAMIVAAITRHLDLQGDDVVLDLCCGNGALTDQVFARCSGGVGVDLTAYLIEVAKRNFERVPDRLYEVGDVIDYVNRSAAVTRFTKAYFYGAFQLFSEAEAIVMLRTIGGRFGCVQRLFLGNLPDLDRAAAFFAGRDIPPIEHLRRHDKLSGRWWGETEIIELAEHCGWRASLSRMPEAFYAAHYRFDAVLTR